MDLSRYPCVKMAFDAGKLGGTATTVFNSSNEEARPSSVWYFHDGVLLLYFDNLHWIESVLRLFKETLVTAGHIINKKIKQYNVELIPLDSEHSAIFQCLNGKTHEDIKNIILTGNIFMRFYCVYCWKKSDISN